jgi:uracil-DNA glycosylase
MFQFKNFIANINENWSKVLEQEFNTDYMTRLQSYLEQQYANKNEIYPPKELIFSALNYTDLNEVKVVILGQDPYHGEGQAHGLSFSVPKGEKIPPSLRNIYKEIALEYNSEQPSHGNLEAWAKQGVLMLNAVLTVEAGKAGSHQKKGWELFTDKLIQIVNDQCSHVVFLLWGSHAQKKGKIIDRQKHLVLEAPHPSPLSAHRGFLGSDHFKKANAYLTQNAKEPIDWVIK